MVIVDGQYFDGRQPIAVPATLEIGGGQAKVTAGPITAYYATAGLKVSARTGTAHRFIALPDGGQLLCEDGPGLGSIARESPSEGPAAWLEARWGVAVASVLGVAAALVAAYVFVLPVVAERLAARIPVATEQALGREALDWLDGQKWLKPTGLDATTRGPIVEGFDRLREDLPLREHYRLEFRASLLGPNALALPGGIIVVTDALVNKAESPDEVLAVLAHEIAHVELRHAMRGIIQGSVVAVVAATVTADATSLNVAIAGLPALLAQTKYSRKFEADADEYAFGLLKRKGYSPAAFATLLERLSRPDRENALGPFSYTSTHPVSADRIRRAHEAAAR
jgi:Zn-dependent protease with chaperone function